MEEIEDSKIIESSLPDADNLICNIGNINQCIHHLNEEFAAMGIRKFNENNFDENLDMTTMINTVFELIRIIHHHIHTRERNDEKQTSITAELNHHKQDNRRLKSRVEILEKDLVKNQLELRDAKKQIISLETRLKAEKDELKRLNNALLRRDLQYKRNNHKYEQELEKAKDKIGLLLNDKSSRKIVMDISDLVARNDGRRGRWKDYMNNTDELYRNILHSYEQKQNLLLIENYQMRKMLYIIIKQLLQLHIDYPSADESDSKSVKEDFLFIKNQMIDQFQMPIEISSNVISNCALQFVERLRNKLEKSDYIIQKNSSKEISPSKSLLDDDIDTSFLINRMAKITYLARDEFNYPLTSKTKSPCLNNTRTSHRRFRSVIDTAYSNRSYASFDYEETGNDNGPQHASSLDRFNEISPIGSPLRQHSVSPANRLSHRYSSFPQDDDNNGLSSLDGADLQSPCKSIGSQIVDLNEEFNLDQTDRLQFYSFNTSNVSLADD